MSSPENKKENAEKEKEIVNIYDLSGLIAFYEDQQLTRMGDEKKSPEQRNVHQESFSRFNKIKGVLDSLINQGINTCEGTLLELNSKIQSKEVSDDDKLAMVETIKFVEQNQDALPSNYVAYQKGWLELRDKYIK